MNAVLKSCLILGIGLHCAYDGYAQSPISQGVDYPVFLDKHFSLSELTVFQSKDNSNHYYYIPNHVQLQRNNGVLQLGFLQYKSDNKSESTGDFWMTLTLEVSQEQLKRASQELLSYNSNGILLGSMAYDSGAVQLISFAKNNAEILGTSHAPTMIGDAVAVTFSLDALAAEKLYQSLRMPVPNIQINFKMTLRGYNSPVGMRLVMDSEKIYKHTKMEAGAKFYYISADIERLFKDLQQQDAIQVERIGEVEAAWDTLFKDMVEKFKESFFDPVTQLSDKAQLDSPAELLKVEVGLKMSFQQKQIRQKGKKQFDYNKVRTATMSRGITLKLPPIPKEHIKVITD